MKDLYISRSESKTLLYWFLVLAIIMLVFVFIKINVYDPVAERIQLENKKYEVVHDQNKYHIAITNIYNLYHYISDDDVESIMEVLNKDYVEKNGITKDNLMSKDIFNFVGFVQFKNQRMCSKQLADGRTSYIVVGEDATDPMNGMPEFLGKKYYDIVLDSKTFTFDIAPITEEFFEEECANE